NGGKQLTEAAGEGRHLAALPRSGIHSQICQWSEDRRGVGAVRIRVGDCKLFFDVDGAKLRPDGPKMREMPTLVLLHGGPGFDHSLYKPAFSCLTDVAQVIYLDHRGQGRSDRCDASKYNLAQWGDDVRSFCEALEIEHPIV